MSDRRGLATGTDARAKPRAGLARADAVVLCVVLLAGLLVAVAGIRRARQTAQEVTTRDRLRRLGLSLQVYVDQARTFPMGGMTAAKSPPASPSARAPKSP